MFHEQFAVLYLVFANQYWPSLIGTVCLFAPYIDDFNEFANITNNTRSPTYSHSHSIIVLVAAFNFLSPESRSRRLICVVSPNPITLRHYCLQSSAYCPSTPWPERMYVLRIPPCVFLLTIKSDEGHQQLSKPYPLDNLPSSEPSTRGSS